MSDTTVTADKIVNHNLVAKGNVNGYDLPGGNITQNFTSGGNIGTVYSYITDNSGNVWWMFYATPADYDNQNPFYVKHSATLLDCPDLPGIMAQIAAAAETAAIAQKGAVVYYLDKYLPWIVGGVVVAVALPTLLKSSKNVSGMSPKNKKMLLIAGGAVAAYFLFIKKSTAATVKTPITTPNIANAPQQILSTANNALSSALKSLFAPATPNAQMTPQQGTVPITDAGTVLSYDPTTTTPQYLQSIGPLPITYDNPIQDDQGGITMNGRVGYRRKRLGSRFTN